MQIDERYRAALQSAGLTDFAAVMATQAGTPVSVHADRSAVRLQVDINGQRCVLYLKRTLRHSVLGLLRDLVFGRRPQARPVREYDICKRLAALGIPAMKAVGCGQRTRWGLPTEAFVLVEAVPAEMSLAKAWGKRADGRPRLPLAEKRQIVQTLGRVVGRLHGEGLRWPDLVSKHVLLTAPRSHEGVTQPRWETCLIDLERVEPSQSEKDRQRDLARLWASLPAGSVGRTDLLRFARAYSQCENDPRAVRRAALARQFGWVRRWAAK